MKQIMKKWKGMLLVVLVLIMSLATTAFATGLPEGEGDTGNLSSPQEPADPQEPESSSIKLDDENNLYYIKFVEPDAVYTYTGEAIVPEIKVYTVVKDDTTGEETEVELGVKAETEDNAELVNYEISYENNVNASTEDQKAKVIVNGNPDAGYEGTITAEFEIQPKSLADAEFKLAGTKYTYAGKAINPAVTVTLDGVTLTKDTDYTVAYVNNNAIGTAKVTITGKGNYTGTKELTYNLLIGTPKLTTSTAYNKVTVSWNKIAGATKYVLQRSTSKTSNFKTIQTITDGSVKYVDKDVKFNKTYYYRIKAYSKSTSSNFSAVVSRCVRPAIVSGVDVSRKSYTSLKISWKKVSGANGYAVYRSTSEKGTYKKIATVKGGSTLSYINKNLTCGKTYYYKVRAYRTVSGKNYYGSYSSADSTYTRPSKVSWNSTSTAYNSTTITLKWKKASGAKGYEIYCSENKNSGYKKVKTITSGSTLSWKDSGLTKGKVYYYKVRAYCKNGSKYVYGSFSNVYTKTIAGWRYSTYDGKKVKLYYNASGKLVKDVSNIIGKQSSYVIKVNKKKCTVTVYAKDGSNGYIIPVKAFICSPGQSTPTGTFYTPQKYRWHTLMGPCWGQWCTRIHGGVLFHSVFYNSYNNNNTLSVSAYNKLGTICSHGCVRLTAGDAKWIYDNCKLKTKVIIYNSSNAGPLGKPSAYKLAYGHTWDPTDPNMKSKCAKRGCH